MDCPAAENLRNGPPPVEYLQSHALETDFSQTTENADVQYLRPLTAWDVLYKKPFSGEVASAHVVPGHSQDPVSSPSCLDEAYQEEVEWCVITTLMDAGSCNQTNMIKDVITSH